MTDIHYRSADGLDLYARSYGPQDAALPVLCMHGLTRNHRDFEPMIETLPGHYRFIAVDVRGRGASQRSDDPATYSPAVYADDMFTLLDHLGLERAALIGTSMGGLMAMLMARKAPQRVRGMVLNDVGPVVESAGLARIASYSSSPQPVASWTEAAAKTAAAQKVAFPEYDEDDWLAFARRTWREQADRTLLPDYDPAITRSLGEAKPGLVTKFAMWRVFGALKAHPMLVIRGETSDILSARTANRMIRRHPDSELVTVPGRGHAPMLDEPVAVEAITTFLGRLEGRS